jgi:ACS family hexuronate transporter-like MFS transporter
MNRALSPPRSAAWKWWVCGLLLLATMLNYMDRLTLNLTSSLVMDAFWLGESDYGQLESVFAFAFALGSISFGWLADRINVRWLYPAALLAWSGCGLATGLVATFQQLLWCRFFLGLFEGSNWPCALRTTQRILPPEQRALGNGILQSGTALGSVLTPVLVWFLVNDSTVWRLPTIAVGGVAPAKLVLPDYTWRLVFLVVGGLGVSWILLWLPSLRTADLQLPRAGAPPALLNVIGWLAALLALDMYLHSLELPKEWFWVPLTSKIVTTALGIGGVIFWLLRATRGDTQLPRTTFYRRLVVMIIVVVTINATWHFLRAWLPRFLATQHGYSTSESSLLFIGYYLGADAGSLTAGFLTVLLVRRGWGIFSSRIAVFTAFAMLALVSVAAPYLPTGPLLVVVLIVMGIGALGIFPMYYAFSQELTTQHQGKMTGCLGCITWLSMSLLHEAAGNWVQETKSYAEGMALAGLAPLVALAALLLLWWPNEKPLAA